MTEELVTLETAKLLKEKGFNEYCKNVIDIDNILSETLYRTNDNLPKQCFSLPIQSIAQKWLRETKNLHITIYNSASGYTYDISKADMGTVLYCFPEGPNDAGNWNTYEEALEAGIIKALKLI
nr:MAG TPA: hypothetical protein [Caudoviricetes sp.]